MSTYDDDLVEEFYEQLENTMKEIPRKDLLIIHVTGMPRLDLMPMNNGQEQWDALGWEKPMTGEKNL